MYSLIEKQTQAQPALKRYIHYEKTRNRQTTRQVEVFAVPSNLDPLWKAANCVIKVERSGTRAGKDVKSISYYLCSKPPQSRTLAAGIRGHWLPF